MNAIMPAVVDCMTPSPHVVAPDESLSRARGVMEEHGIRHLPVMRGDTLVGIVTERDMNLVYSVAPVPPESITVEDAMSADPYVVPPDAPLQPVARTMADRKLGSAIVVDHGRVVGVFTTTDALHALEDMLAGRDVRGTFDTVGTAPPGRRRSHEHDVPRPRTRA
jgi:acetoin utilization protein AcuB